MELLVDVLGRPGPEAFCAHSPLWLGDLLPGELPTFAPARTTDGPPSHHHLIYLCISTGNNWRRQFWGNTKSAEFESGINMGNWVSGGLEIESGKKVPGGLLAGNVSPGFSLTIHLRGVSS